MNAVSSSPLDFATDQLITVVVCTRNRADRLPVALDSLAHLWTGGRFRYEVLVVDNGSTDQTVEVVSRWASTFPVSLRVVCEPQPGVAKARNRGVHEARGQWIAFFDDDQAADPAWLEELLLLAERRDSRAVGGRVRLSLPLGVDRQLSPVCEMLLGCSVNMENERLYSPSCTPGAGNLMVQREVFEQVGDFDESLTRGEDTDLFVRMYVAGIDCWYTPAAIIDHLIPPERLTDEFLLRLSRRMGECMAASEYIARGPKLYPLVYAARVAQTVGVLLPRWLICKLLFRREAALGAACRLTIAWQVLREGIECLLTGSANLTTKSTANRRQTH